MMDPAGRRLAGPAQAHLGVGRWRSRQPLASDGPSRDPHPAPTAWRLKLDPDNQGCDLGWHERELPPDAVPAEVPGVWNTAYPGYSGVGWYACQFEPRLPPGGQTRLVVGAANYLTDVWLNGVHVGRHEGGYDAFSVPAGAALSVGSNRLVLRIVDPRPEREIDGLLLRECPTGKESWYGGAGGPWGGVWLERSAAIAFEDVQVRADLVTGLVRFQAALVSDLRNATSVVLRADVADPSGRRCAAQITELRIAPGRASASLLLGIPDRQAWSPSAPNLYRWQLTVESGDGDAGQVDGASGQLGFRTVGWRDGVFHLNSAPLFLKGALLQPTYPRTLLGSPVPDWPRTDVQAARRAGLNLLRVHLRPPLRSMLDAADREGVLLYVEPPLAWIEPSERLLEHGRRELAAMVRACGNHPSVALWGIFNENARATHEVGGALMAELAALDPTRPTIEDSGGAAVGEVDMWAWDGQSRCWSPGWESPRPLNDIHIYLANPPRREARNVLTSVGDGPILNVTPGRTAAEQVESRLTSDPVVVSEYGCGALPDFDAALAQFGDEEHLADAQLLRVLRDNLARGLAERGLTDEIGDVPALTRRTQALQAEGVLAQTAALRRNPNVAGIVITQLADAGWEQMAGLTSLWRTPRPALAALRHAMRPRLLHLETDDPCSDGAVTVRAWLIEERGLPALRGAAVLSVSVVADDSEGVDLAARSMPVVARPRPGRPLATLTLPLPERAGRWRIVARLRADGWTGEARADGWRLPDRQPAAGAGLIVLGRTVRRLLPDAQTSVPAGWRGPILAETAIPIAESALRTATDAARAGAHLVLAGLKPSSAERLGEILGLPLRVHGARGNFMGVYHYRRRHPAFEGLGGPGLADGAWAETLPAWALAELPDADIAAGCFSVPDGGRDFLWRATVQTVRYGAGRVTMWQLPLGQRRGGRLGAHLLDGLVRWLTHPPQ
ncbi:MAG: hypothetical protein IT306_02545 [Chloroflexi bacterium]|nr:hypothetical protein [Chloroflexota bacterium]